MTRSHLGILLVTSIAGFALSGSPTSTLANDIAAPAAQTAPVQSADVALELSAQRRIQGGMVRPGTGRGIGNDTVSRVRRVSRFEGIGRVSRIEGRISRISRIDGRVSRISRIDGRVSRIDGRIMRISRIDGRVSRISRIDGRIMRIERISRISRISRIGRIGRIGIIPIPVPLDPGVPVVPGQRITTPPCPVCPVQACLVAIYTDPNLMGRTVETADNQPRLDQSGWQNQISSIIVKGGTWEFYPDLEFRGGPPVLRLAPGSYAVLEPQWTKRIGSFMCVR